MQWIYLPKSRNRPFLNKNKDFGLFNSLPRRSSPKETYRFVNMLIGMYMLWIFVEIGFYIPYSMSDPSALPAMSIVDGITLPESNYRTELAHPRLAIYFVIDKTGIINVQGEELPSENTVEYLKELLFFEPRGIALLIIDKETSMEFVIPLLQQLREAGMYKVVFSTSKEYETNTHLPDFK